MRLALRSLAVAVLFAVLAGSQSPPRKTYRITGVVVNRATGQVMPHTRILMHAAGKSSSEFETSSDGTGKFVFERVWEGMWSLYAEHEGFVRQGFGARPGVPDSFTQVVTGPNGASEDLTFPLDAPAAVSGKIVDEDGEPVPAALEIIIELETGIHRFERIRNAMTDERGEFRIGDLPAVKCYLLAVAAPPQVDDPSEAPETLSPTYYSNTPDARAATVLDLKPGEEYRADFTMRRAHGVSVKVDGEIGSSVGMLSAEGPGGAGVILNQFEAGQGRTFYNLSPGRYQVTLFDPRTNEQSARTVEVKNEDITLHAPFEGPTVNANVRLVDADPSLLTTVNLWLHADGEYQTHARTVGADGKVTLSGMTGGRYKFLLATAGLYIKSFRADVPNTDRMVDLPGKGAVKLDVVLAGDGGEVSGYVRSKGKPVAPARVVLAPRNDSTNSADYSSYQTESDGSFRYQSVKPGDYVVFATTDFKLEFGNPAAIRRHLGAGMAVHVEPKSTVNVEIEPL